MIVRIPDAPPWQFVAGLHVAVKGDRITSEHIVEKFVVDLYAENREGLWIGQFALTMVRWSLSICQGTGPMPGFWPAATGVRPERSPAARVYT